MVGSGQVFLLVSTFPLSLIAIAYIVPETPFAGDAGRWPPPSPPRPAVTRMRLGCAA